MNIPFYRFLEVGAFSMLNLMPFLVLAIYPFRRHLRFSKRATNYLMVGMAIIQLFLGYMAAFSPVGSEIMSLLSTVIYAGFYFFVIKDNIGRLTFVLLVFSNVGNLVTVCAKCLEGLFFGDIALEAYRWSMIVCMFIMHALITMPVAFYIRKYFNSSVPIQTKSWSYLWVIPATFYVTWFYHLYISGNNSLMVALELHHAAFLVLINIGAFVIYHIAILLLFEQKKSTELEQNNHLLTLQTLHHENLQKRIQETRQFKHDMHHHIHLAREYLRSGKVAELEAYLDQYSASFPDAQATVYCQHYETNALLNYYAHKAQQNSIATDIFVQFPKEVSLAETTLSTVLGNLLENAIDASRELEADQRKITIRGKLSGGFVFWEITNNYAGHLKKNKAGDLLTTKARGQGLGLHSVARLVEHHNGVFQVDTQENTFRVTVMLQEQPGN